jgi:hypothetical protein
MPNILVRLRPRRENPEHYGGNEGVPSNYPRKINGFSHKNEDAPTIIQ